MPPQLDPRATCQPAERLPSKGGLAEVRRWWPLLRAALLVAVLVPWVLAVRANWAAARDYPWRLAPGYLLASLALLLATMIGCGVAWWWLLKRMGTSLPLRQAVGIWLTAQMARYIPGPAWDVAGRAALCARAGLDVTRVSVGLVMELATAVMAYAALVLAALPFWPLPPGGERLRLLPLLVPLGLLALYPPLLSRGANAVLRLLRRSPVHLAGRYGDVLSLWCLEVLLRIGEGVAFALFLRSLLSFPLSRVPMLVGAHSAAWLVGFFAIFAPSGLGVREGVLAYALTPLMPLSVAAAAAVGYRLCVSGRDLLAFGLARLLSRPQEPVRADPAPQGAAPLPAQARD